jgi:hypothetical protein
MLRPANIFSFDLAHVPKRLLTTVLDFVNSSDFAMFLDCSLFKAL